MTEFKEQLNLLGLLEGFQKNKLQKTTVGLTVSNKDILDIKNQLQAFLISRTLKETLRTCFQIVCNKDSSKIHFQSCI